jgi:hypothetical protein
MVTHRGIGIPDVMEMTLYNRSRAEPGAYRSDYPHALDVDNCTNRPSLTLPDCWR